MQNDHRPVPDLEGRIIDALDTTVCDTSAEYAVRTLETVIDVTDATLGPLLDEIIDTERQLMASDRNWVFSHGLYLSLAVGHYRKLLTQLRSMTMLQSLGDPESAWHVLTAAGSTAEQLTEMIADPEGTCALTRADKMFRAQTALVCAAATRDHLLPVPDLDIARETTDEGSRVTTITGIDVLTSVLDVADAGAEAARWSLAPVFVNPSNTDDLDTAPAVELQCALATTLLRGSTSIAFDLIGDLCVDDDWTGFASEIESALAYAHSRHE